MGKKYKLKKEIYRANWPGSLIQQNYAESTSKGYLLWDIKDKDDFDTEFVELPNVCPFYTIRLDKDLDLKEVPFEDIQKNARIRIISRELNIAEKKEIKSKLDLLFEPIEVKFQDDSSVSQRDFVINNKTAKAESLDNIEIQEELIKDFLKPYSLSDEVLFKIYELNKKYDKEVKSLETISRNTIFHLNKMKFSNMMSFGGDNEFDFQKYKGIVGVFGSNGVGKSSTLVDIPLYCLFNKISKKGVVKNDLLINDNKDNCFVDMDVRLNKDLLKIKRSTSIYLKSGKKRGKPVYQGKTDVDFKIIRDGQEIDMNGSERADTDKNIRSLIGDIDTFIMTSVAPQFALMGLLEAGGTERLKTIGNYFGIEVFDKKHSLAKEDQRDIKALIKSVKDVSFDKEIEQYSQKIGELKKEIKVNKGNKETSEKLRDKLKEDLIRHQIGSENTELTKKTAELTSILREFESRNGVYDRQKKGILAKIERLNKYDCIKNVNCSLLLEQKSHKEDLEKCEKDIQDTTEKVILAKDRLEKLKKKIEEEKNKNKNEKTKEIEKEIRGAEENIRLYSSAISRDTREIAKLEEKIENLERQRNIFYENKEKFDCFEHYLKTIGKDGIVKKIIADNLNIINSEIDKLLSETVSFRVEITAENNGKEIEIYFIPARGEKRRIELCSGMERSMTALVIRVALTKITTLPKTDVLILDEPISSLDDEYLFSFGKMLEHLRDYFETIFIISHNDNIKDFCDHIYTVDRDETGQSRIY